MSRREEEDFRSFLKDDWLKDCFCGFLEDEAETTAEVSLGRDLAISTLADLEASSDVLSAKSKIRSLSKSLSSDNEEESRALR